MASSAPFPDRDEEPASDAIATGTAVRADVVRLVRERRYEDALALLYAARADAPDSKEIAASIRQIKEFLVGAYAKRLGGLDRVAGPVPLTGARFPDALLVARYVDGSSTFDDICRSCPLGQLRTLQVLVALYAGTESAPPLLGTPAPPRAALREVSSIAPREAPSIAPREAPALAPWEAPAIARASSVPPPDEPTPSTQRAQAPAWRRDDAERVSQVYETPRPPSIGPAAPPESPEDAQYKQAFARGTAAFVQRRFADAVDAFRECERLRPTDAAAATMLRRALRDAERG